MRLAQYRIRIEARPQFRAVILCLAARIKPAAEKNIEGMHCQGEFAESVGGCVVESAGFKPSPRALETEAQRQVFVRVAQRAQETAHLFRARVGGTDGFQRGGQFRGARRNRLEERALELAAALGAFRIDAATVLIAERGAGLGEFRVSGFGFRVQRVPAPSPDSPNFTDGQSERFEMLRVVARLEFNVLEENAIAAQAAGEAKPFWQGTGRGHRGRVLRLIVTPPA
jgi:hypothetical protein